ncbi:MAG: 3'-5' exonuclease, partial [Gemmatimonadota bacterium]
VSLQEAAARAAAGSGGDLAADGAAAAPAHARAPAQAALRTLLELVGRFGARAATEPLAGFLEDLLDESGLLASVRESGEPDAEERADNLRELVASAVEFGGGSLEPDLPGFLQDVALLSEVDKAELGGEAATLLTMHNAKGLEFPVVFVAGLEEGLLPLTRGGESAADLEEERRLFYVALTRAREQVVLTCARRRARFGWSEDSGAPSRFLAEIPSELLRVEERHGWRSGSALSSLPGFSGPRGRWRGGRGTPAWRGGSGADAHGFVADEEPDYDVPQDLAPRYAAGERVRHARFGTGTIRRVTGFGHDLRVQVRFDSEGEKTLVARLARLERET